MSGPGNGAILKPLRSLFEGGTAAGASDPELLDRFIERGPGAEAAFSALLERHGPMVLAVCRRLAGDPSSADDAFQATWLALVRRSGSIRLNGSLAPWLFAVSRRIALRARARAARHHLPGKDAPEPIDPTSPADLAERADQLRVVVEEIARLPDRYRAPVVLCHVEGRTHDQAAGDLGWPVGTVRVRLSRARHLLRDRLERRGVGLSVGLALTSLRRDAMAAVPPALEAAVLRFVPLTLAGAIASGVVPASVASLQHGAYKMIPLSIGMTALAGTLTLGIAWSGLGLPGNDPEAQEQSVVASPDGSSNATPVASPKSSINPAEGKVQKHSELDHEPKLELVPMSDEEANRSMRQRLAEQNGLISELRRQLDELSAKLESQGDSKDGVPGLPPSGDSEDIPSSDRVPSVAEEVDPMGAEKTENVTTASLLDPTIEEVERLFAEKAVEAIEIEFAIKAWERLNNLGQEDVMSDELRAFFNRTRNTLEARLTAFAGRPEDAAAALQQLRDDLVRLIDLHGALVGPEANSVGILATRCLRNYGQSSSGLYARNDPRSMQNAQRVTSLFSEFGYEVGPPIATSEGLMFGTTGMGMGMMGGGFQ